MSPIFDFAVPATLQRFSCKPYGYYQSIRDSTSPNNYKFRAGDYDDSHRSALKRIAEERLTAIREGGYFYSGVDQDLTETVKEAESKTVYYSPTSYIKRLASSTKPNLTRSWTTRISIPHITTLDTARRLDNINKTPTDPFDGGKIGIFASPIKPGRDFKSGSESQEASIARSSTLYPALNSGRSTAALQTTHTRKCGNCSFLLFSWHDIFSQHLHLPRRRWELYIPLSGLEVGIEKEMSERMGRILYLFERKGVRNIILGTFITGVFGDNVANVARNWAHLLLLPEARFKGSFDRVIFAITGEEIFTNFQNVGTTRTPEGSFDEQEYWYHFMLLSGLLELPRSLEILSRL